MQRRRKKHASHNYLKRRVQRNFYFTRQNMSKPIDQKSNTNTEENNSPKIDKEGRGNNWRENTRLIVEIIIAGFTIILVFVTLGQSKTQVQALAVADSANKISALALADNRRQNRDRDSTDSISSLKQDIKDSFNADFSDKSLKTQVQSIKETERRFNIESRPIANVMDLKIDSLGNGQSSLITFKLYNTGKFPATIKYIRTKSVLDVKLSKNEVEKKIPHGEIRTVNHSLPHMAYIPQKMTGIVLPEFYFELLKKGERFIYILIEINYENFVNKEKYRHQSVIKAIWHQNEFSYEGMKYSDIKVKKW